jgi:hypothetical protein
MNFDSTADAHALMNTSIKSTEISDAMDYIADHEGPNHDWKDSFKVGYLISSLAWSNRLRVK